MTSKAQYMVICNCVQSYLRTYLMDIVQWDCGPMNQRTNPSIMRQTIDTVPWNEGRICCHIGRRPYQNRSPSPPSLLLPLSLM